jgi:hypothetical protein
MVRVPASGLISSLRYTSLPRDWNAEREVEAALRGERFRPAVARNFAYMALQHGVAGLLVEAGATDWLPPEAGGPLLDEARRQAALAMLRTHHLRPVFKAIRQDQLGVLAVKGVHLAWTAYPDPALRECDDTDLFVSPSDRGRFLAVLGRLGYEEQGGNVGDLVLGQSTFEKPGAIASALDVHSRLSAPRLPSELFAFDALWSRSVAVPAFDGEIRVPGPVDALMLAVMHQAVHHDNHAFLLWTYDVHLLLRGLGDLDAERFATRAIAAGVPEQCGYPIADAQQRFPTRAGAFVLERFAAARRTTGAAIRLAPRQPLRQLVLDLHETPGWRARLLLIGSHLFPPAVYMRRSFAPHSRLPLPCLYAWRIVQGARKWL